MPTKIEKIEKMTDVIYQMRLEVGQHCWQVSLFKNLTQSEIPNEIVTARKEVENENKQKLCYEMDQMYIEEDFGIEANTQELAPCENDEEEMVTLELIPENKGQKLPKKPLIQSCITNFFSNNKE